ncbi:YSIRK-type signal peptide-containing protein [Streptococcus lactarius]|uniref:YSIRK-type signal peptide-containing protein n=1 Tax=Streptococcus lactarius TaxID=684066 RepID=UPI0036186F54
MKSYREHSSKQETFSIRKLSVGVVSLAVAGLVTVNAYGAEVKADEVTTPAAEATTAATATDHATSQLTSTTVTEGNKTVTTTYVESPELEKAKATAKTEGATVTEEAEKSNHRLQQQKWIIKFKQLKSIQPLKTTRRQKQSMKQNLKKSP